jgi:ADP-heptose:LPS heptosyltransferase
MNIIFQINGGIGKCVAATAICEVIKKKYPESILIVVSGYADVFLNNPFVDRAYNYGGMSYFHEEYVENKELIVFAHDPY